MARAWSSNWPTAAAGTMDENDIRHRGCAFIRGEIAGNAVETHWTDDGTSGGTAIPPGGNPEWAIPMMQDRQDSGTWSLVGCYGPVVDTTASEHSVSDLYFGRSEHVSGFVSMSRVYNSGIDSDGNLRTTGSGRSFFDFYIYGDQT